MNGKLIHQTEKYLYIDILGKTMRLRSDDVIALSLIPEHERSGLLELAEKVGPHTLATSSNQAKTKVEIEPASVPQNVLLQAATK